MTETPDFCDLIQPFQIESLGVRGRLVRLGPAVDGVLRNHGYTPVVAGLLAETLALTTVLASGLKYDGVFSLQIQGDGPINLMVADMTSDGDLRGYARTDAERLVAAEAASGGLVPRLLGAGHMAFTVDQGPDTERYQGITELTGATLSECAHNYFRQSEQLESAIVLAGVADSGGVGKAAGIALQRLPPKERHELASDEADEAWRRAVILMSSVTVDELLDPGLVADDLLFRLFHQEGVRVFQPRPVGFACRCSRKRVARTLASFPKTEVSAMAVDGKVAVTCEFCKSDYTFDAAAVDALYNS